MSKKRTCSEYRDGPNRPPLAKVERCARFGYVAVSITQLGGRTSPVWFRTYQEAVAHVERQYSLMGDQMTMSERPENRWFAKWRTPC